MGEELKINISEVAHKAKAAEIIARDSAEAEAESVVERKVEPHWREISDRLGRNREQIQRWLKEDVLAGKMTIPSERVWSVDDYGTPRPDLYYNPDGEEGAAIRRALLDRLTEWFNREIADGISVEIDNQSNVVLKWQIPESAQ